VVVVDVVVNCLLRFKIVVCSWCRGGRELPMKNKKEGAGRRQGTMREESQEFKGK